MSQNPAHDAEMTICGETVAVPRTLEMVKRLEAICGPLYPAAARIESVSVTTSDVARIYQAIVRDLPGKPPASAIDEWLFAVGLFKYRFQLSTYLASLVIGSDNLARVTETLKEGEVQGEARGPFSAAA